MEILNHPASPCGKNPPNFCR
ncbi:Putative uncharacterized protein [Lactococcus lactis subsp. lactis A12]|uniref:Uncharacterized protein n=1 Tax=Lactococcus lactis subsp. lactis A12 TaxID=1137134 RepID=S6EWV1_LACLL|nr:Putative uncharacterized protein [Lactococcus lactis subsp. lactis A12]SBW30930.1 Hypothetical protein LLA12_01781 [Lactococcus lactis subsp. lactis]